MVVKFFKVLLFKFRCSFGLNYVQILVAFVSNFKL